MATLAYLATVASAQEAPHGGPSRLAREELPRIYLPEDRATEETPEIDQLATELPRTMAEMLQGEPTASPFSLGAAVGFLQAKRSDDVTWFGGVQARLRMGDLSAAASIQFPQNKYGKADAAGTHFPLQRTAFLYF